jgi:site-specific recombinase XerD
VHSFFRFAAFEAPTHSAQIQRVLAIPAKRFTRALVPFLSRQEVDALLAAPDQQTWSGRRDHALLLLAVQTGLRLSELTSLQHDDLHVGVGAHVRVIGKGRKERCTPLSKNTRAVLAAWAREPPLAEEPAAVPQRTRWQSEFSWRALPAQQARQNGRREVPVTKATNV